MRTRDEERRIQAEMIFTRVILLAVLIGAVLAVATHYGPEEVIKFFTGG